MAASSNITIDPISLLPLSNELKEIKKVLIEAKSYSEYIRGSIHRIEKGGVIDFISKSTLQTSTAKDKDPETTTTLKKLANFLDQKVDKTKEQKIESPTAKLAQPTVFKSIVQSTHKLVEDITSKSVEEFKKTKLSESKDSKDSTLNTTLHTYLKQLTSLLGKKEEPKNNNQVTPTVIPSTAAKASNQNVDSVFKQIGLLLDSTKNNKIDNKNVIVKSDDSNIQKVLKSIELLKSSKKEENAKQPQQNENLFRRITSIFENIKDVKNKAVDVKVDDSALQKVIKTLTALGAPRNVALPSNAQNNLRANIKVPDNNTKALPLTTSSATTDTLKSNKNIDTKAKDIVLSTPTSNNNNTFFKKITDFFENFKQTKTINQTLNVDNTPIQKILKSFLAVSSIKTEQPSSTQKSEFNNKSVVTTVNNQNTQSLNLNDTFVQRLLKALDQRYAIKGDNDSQIKQNTLDTNKLQQPKYDASTKVSIPKLQDTPSQKNTLSNDLSTVTTQQETSKPSDQSDGIFKKLTSFVSDLKAVKTDTKSFEVKKDDNSLQKILKSIEFLKPTKKDETSKSSDQSDGIFKKLTSFVSDLKAVKTDTKSFEVKKDDNSLQKILKSIEFLKPSKKEDVVKPSDQSEGIFKKLTSFVSDLKDEKTKSVNTKKDDTNTQKALTPSTFLTLSKKDENTKSTEQNESIFKRLTSFLSDSKDEKTKNKSAKIKESDTSLQKVLKSIDFLKVTQKKSPTNKTEVKQFQEDLKGTPKNNKPTLLSAGIQAVKKRLTNVFTPSTTKDDNIRANNNSTNKPNILERLNVFRQTVEKQPQTIQNSKNTNVTPTAQNISEQKKSTITTSIPTVTPTETTNTKTIPSVTNTKPEGEAQKELFAKEDVSEKILKTLEHIDRTAKEILKSISGTSEPQVVKSEEKKGSSQKSEQQTEDSSSPLDLLDLIPGKLKQRARILAKKTARAARRIFSKGKALISKGAGVLKNATGKALTAGKTILNKVASTGAGQTITKGATTVKNIASNVLEKGGAAAKNTATKMIESGKSLVNKVANTETVKGASGAISRGAAPIKNTASNLIEKGSTIAKDVTGKALKTGKGIIGKITGTSATAASKGAAAAGQTAAGGLISKAATFGAGALKSGGKALGFLGKIAKGAGSLALKAGKAIPGVGGIIGTGMAAYSTYSDIQEINEKVKNGEMTPEEATVAKAKAIGKGVGSAAGSFIPGVGGLVGDLAGGWVGEKVGGAIGNTIASNKTNTPETPQTVSETSSNTTPSTVPATSTNSTSVTDNTKTPVTQNSTQTDPTAIKNTPTSPVTSNSLDIPATTSTPPSIVTASPASTTPTAPLETAKSSLWERAKTIGTKALEYGTPLGMAYTATKNIVSKFSPETTSSTNTNQISPMNTPNVVSGGADPNSALKQVAEGIATSNSNDRDLAASILKMSEALVAAGLMKTPPVQLNNIIQGGNEAPKIDLKQVFSNNRDPIKTIRNEFAV